MEVISPTTHPPEINYFMFHKDKSSQKKTDKNKNMHICVNCVVSHATQLTWVALYL